MKSKTLAWSAFNEPTKYGDSALFFSLKYEQWDFLKRIVNSKSDIQQKEDGINIIVPIAKPSLTVKDADSSTRQLLISKAKMGDISFFEKVFQAGIVFHEREVVGAAVESGQSPIVSMWPADRWKDAFIL